MDTFVFTFFQYILIQNYLLHLESYRKRFLNYWLLNFKYLYWKSVKALISLQCINNVFSCLKIIVETFKMCFNNYVTPSFEVTCCCWQPTVNWTEVIPSSFISTGLFPLLKLRLVTVTFYPSLYCGGHVLVVMCVCQFHYQRHGFDW